MTITVNKNQLIQTFALNHVVSTEIAVNLLGRIREAIKGQSRICISGDSGTEIEPNKWLINFFSLKSALGHIEYMEMSK